MITQSVIDSVLFLNSMRCFFGVIAFVLTMAGILIFSISNTRDYEATLEGTKNKLKFWSVMFLVGAVFSFFIRSDIPSSGQKATELLVSMEAGGHIPTGAEKPYVEILKQLSAHYIDVESYMGEN